MPRKFFLSNIILILLIALENAFLFFFYRHHITTQSLNAKCLFITSLLFGLVLIYKFYKTTVSDVSIDKSLTRNNYIVMGVFISILIIGGIYFNEACRKSPISVAVSDIIPFIQVLCKRFLSGRYVYGPINNWGYPNVQSNYLPMHWLPYCIAEVMHFDYRFISYFAWCMAALILFKRTAKTNNSIIMQLLVAILILGNYFIIFIVDYGMLVMTVELLIASYYVLFITGINQKNVVVQGLVVSFCLLSRYSLILWLPLAAFTLIMSGNKIVLFKIGVVVLLTITLLYVLPFLSKDHLLFYNAYKNYANAARGEWYHLDDNNYPVQLYQGCGFAYIFYYKLNNLDIDSRIKVLQTFHFVLCALIIIIMGCWYWFKKQYIHYRIFLMGSFKIYLSVFFAFIMVPYPYLMIVGNFVSVAIFCEQLRYKNIQNAKKKRIAELMRLLLS